MQEAVRRRAARSIEDRGFMGSGFEFEEVSSFGFTLFRVSGFNGFAFLLFRVFG